MNDTSSTTPVLSTVTYVEGLKPRSRASWCIVVRGDDVVPFKGASIPGLVAATVTARQANGKWSTVTHSLRLATGARAIIGSDGFETATFAEGLGRAVLRPTPSTWDEIAACLGVSRAGAMNFMRLHKPKTSAKIDAYEAALAALTDGAS